MKILLSSFHGIGAWYLLRLIREGHDCDWWIIDPAPREENILRGLIPPPLKNTPKFEKYDLVIFDCTGQGELAEEVSKVTPVIGDSMLASRLEDDRLFGIEAMEECGIEVPPWETFDSPEDAKQFITENPKRYVFKPFSIDSDGQECDTTYVSESAEDLIKCLDSLWKDSQNAPFLLQEVVEGVEIAANGYFDGAQFHFVTHTLEEKKFMSGGYGPNTGCSGNLIYWPNGPNRLISTGLFKLAPFLQKHGYRGPIDLNTIVNENHIYGLEFTPRFGYDSTATEVSMLDGDLGQFLFDIATAPEGGCQFDPVPSMRARYSASARLTVPPYPEEHAKFDAKLPVKGINLDDAWLNCYMFDAMVDTRKSGEEGIVTAGVNGIVCCPVSTGHTPEGAWKGLERVKKSIKFPNMQVRDDLEKTTIKRLKDVQEMGWI